MKGFFSKQDTASNDRQGGKASSCASCGRYIKAKTPRMKAQGNYKKRILIIGCSPDKYEDRAASYLVTKEGKYLTSLLAANGIDIDNDCMLTTAVRCYAGEKYPTSDHITNCRRNTMKLITEHEPRKVILLGSDAIRSVIGHRWQKGIKTTAEWRGWKIPDQDLMTWLYPMQNPSEVLQQDRKELTTIFETDIKEALGHAAIPFEKIEPNITYLEENELYRLNKIVDGFISIDYETTGIKPHAKGHRIVCASVAHSENEAYVFMLPTSRKLQKPFIQLLQNDRVLKMAHNMKFEDTWTKVRLKTEIEWEWDSMIASHILDNRPSICGLKFQSYVRLGIVDYDSEISPYLKGLNEKEVGGNALNRVLELCETERGRKELMKYCALDTIYQYRIAMQQMKELNYFDQLPF